MQHLPNDAVILSVAVFQAKRRISGLTDLTREPIFLGSQNPFLHFSRQRFARRSQYQPGCPSAYFHQIRNRPLGVELRSLTQQPAEPFLHHVIGIVQKRIGEPRNFWKEHFRPCPANQCYTSRSSMPAILRFSPPEDSFRPRRFINDHRCNQIMHQRVVVRPTADPVQPRFQQL